MPLPSLKRGPQIDPDATYLAVAGFICPSGSYAAGARVRGDDLSVQRFPHFWIRADATDVERNAAAVALLFATTEPAPAAIKPTPRPVKKVVAISKVGPYRWGEGMGVIEAGALIAADAPPVQAWPRLFRPANAADLAAETQS